MPATEVPDRGVPVAQTAEIHRRLAEFLGAMNVSEILRPSATKTAVKNSFFFRGKPGGDSNKPLAFMAGSRRPPGNISLGPSSASRPLPILLLCLIAPGESNARTGALDHPADSRFYLARPSSGCDLRTDFSSPALYAHRRPFGSLPTGCIGMVYLRT